MQHSLKDLGFYFPSFFLFFTFIDVIMTFLHSVGGCVIVRIHWHSFHNWGPPAIFQNRGSPRIWTGHSAMIIVRNTSVNNHCDFIQNLINCYLNLVSKDIIVMYFQKGAISNHLEPEPDVRPHRPRARQEIFNTK